MKKIGLIAITLVLALGALGVGYAYWTDSLTITGTAEMGNLSAGFTDVTYTPTTYGEDSADIITDDHAATITIDNAYPGWTNTYIFEVTNTGSVPVDISISKTSDIAGIGDAGSGSATELVAGGTANFTVVVTIPSSWGNSEQYQSYTVTYTLDVTQFNAE